MIEYRPVPDEDIDAWSRLLAYAFRPSESYEPTESVEDLPAPATLGNRRGLYEGDELRCTGAHHWFRLRVRGAFEEVPGLSAVSTPPQFRRQGLVRRLLAESLAEYHERGDGFCVLWPFDHSFYRQFGWATCSRRARVTCSPDALSGIGPGETDETRKQRKSSGNDEFRRCSPDDWEALDRVYRATNPQSLAMDRTGEWWRKRVFDGWGDEPYVAGTKRNGEFVGYLVYRIEEAGETGGFGTDRRMVVSEYGYADFDAYHTLVRFCSYHDSQVTEIELHGRVNTTLQDLARDPREIEVEVRPGPMVRIVDVARALSDLSYPVGHEGTIRLDVTDELIERNDGRFGLSVAGGVGTCERIDADESTENGTETDLTASIATLSQVAIGFLSVERAERVGDFAIPSAETRELLGALFPSEDTYLREGF